MIQNDFPPRFIDKYINLRIEKIRKPRVNNNVEKVFDTDKLVVVPYIHENHKQLKNILKKHNFNVVFKPCKNNSGVFRNLKDPIPLYNKTNVVYEIPCKGKDCNGVYIGQTKRKLKTRIDEHIRSCRLDEASSALVRHSHTQNHLFDFNNAKILTTESNFMKRSFAEMFHIIKNQNSVNAKTDVKYLSNAYKNIIYDSRKFKRPAPPVSHVGSSTTQSVRPQ